MLKHKMLNTYLATVNARTEADFASVGRIMVSLVDGTIPLSTAERTVVAMLASELEEKPKPHPSVQTPHRKVGRPRKNETRAEAIVPPAAIPDEAALETAADAEPEMGN